MRYLSVCSGIEAATAAWHGLGWTPVAFSEIEPFPSAVLAHHYPSVPNRGDMTKFQEWPDDRVDLLVGGTPCQSFSVAGLRKGLADPRGNLALVYLGIANKYRPKWIVWENVPGVLSSNGGRDFGSFLGALVQLGYGFAYRVLDAQYFGVPQRRRRVFVVGCLGDWRAAAAVLFERHSLQGHPAPRRKARKATAGGAGGGAEIGRRAVTSHEVAPCLETTSNDYLRADGFTMVAHSLRGEGFDASEDGIGRGTPPVPVAFPARMSGTQCASTEDLSPALGAANPTAVAFSCKDHGADAGELAPTLRAMGHGASHANAGGQVAFSTKLHNTASNGAGKLYEEYTAGLDRSSPPPALVSASAVRRLTPTECERLQGFPDSYTDVPYRNKPADGPRYKALGNSMAVPVMRWIGQRIQAVELFS